MLLLLFVICDETVYTYLKKKGRWAKFRNLQKGRVNLPILKCFFLRNKKSNRGRKGVDSCRQSALLFASFFKAYAPLEFFLSEDSAYRLLNRQEKTLPSDARNGVWHDIQTSLWVW